MITGILAVRIIHTRTIYVSDDLADGTHEIVRDVTLVSGKPVAVIVSFDSTKSGKNAQQN